MSRLGGGGEVEGVEQHVCCWVGEMMCAGKTKTAIVGARVGGKERDRAMQWDGGCRALQALRTSCKQSILLDPRAGSGWESMEETRHPNNRPKAAD